MKTYNVAIIGGGASGLACAASLVKCGTKFKIAVIESCDRLGKKLAATGNGQGNISNLDMSARHFRSGNLPAVKKIACNDPYAGASLFNCICTADEKGRIYPSGRQASALTDSLLHSIDCDSVEIFLKTTVNNLEKGFKLHLSDNTVIAADFVVLCAGGKAQKQFGTDGKSYSLAEKFGHRVTELSPSLVQLKTETTHIKTLRGIRADCNVTAVVNGKTVRRERGDLIFTDYGVSGNAIFALSPVFSDSDGEISIGFLPDISMEEIICDVEKKKALGYNESDLLSGTVHNSLGRAIIKRSGANARKIAETLKDFRLKVTGTLGFDYAQVTHGGIEMGGIDDDLQSKFADKLYFAGEILDVDGDCGGYNLQWAFTSGMYVAKKIAERLKNH